MAETPFIDGDKISIRMESGKWFAELLVSKGTGIIAPSASAMFDTPEAALAALTEQTKTLQRR
ncbi:MAG: hypothetical protein ACOH2N_04740 [Devosia sp.]